MPLEPELAPHSGAVYGSQPAHQSHIPEDFAGAPDLRQPTSAYGELKRMSELMCAMTPEVDCVIARGFGFIGPYLPLSDKFAVGIFIRDAIAGGPIRIQGDGTPQRSFETNRRLGAARVQTVRSSINIVVI